MSGGRTPILFFARRNGNAGWKLVKIVIGGGGGLILAIRILQYLEQGWHIVEWWSK